MDKEDKRRIVVVKQDGKDVEVYLKNPSMQDKERADSVRIKKWNQSLKDGALFYESLSKVLKEQGIWAEDQENKLSELQTELAETIERLGKGGKLSEARETALLIRTLRMRIQILMVDRERYVNETIEGQAQNAEFSYLVSQCAVYNSNRNKKYFASYEDYSSRANDVDAYTIANKCANVLYDSSDRGLWPENKFLKRFGFVNEDLRLINKEGHLIDIDGNLINEAGDRVVYVDGKAVVVDNASKQTGEEESQAAVFFDDDGNVVADKTEASPVVQTVST
jgi:hypothetical protein